MQQEPNTQTKPLEGIGEISAATVSKACDLRLRSRLEFKNPQEGVLCILEELAIISNSAREAINKNSAKRIQRCLVEISALTAIMYCDFDPKNYAGVAKPTEAQTEQ